MNKNKRTLKEQGDFLRFSSPVERPIHHSLHLCLLAVRFYRILSIVLASKTNDGTIAQHLSPYLRMGADSFKAIGSLFSHEDISLNLSSHANQEQVPVMSAPEEIMGFKEVTIDKYLYTVQRSRVTLVQGPFVTDT